MIRGVIYGLLTGFALAVGYWEIGNTSPLFPFVRGLCLPVEVAVDVMAGRRQISHDPVDVVIVAPAIYGLAGGLLGVGWRLLKRPRRVKPGHCYACSYNLTGNLSGVCPECGTEVPEA